jgi:hypothetical protein
MGDLGLIGPGQGVLSEALELQVDEGRSRILG